MGKKKGGKGGGGGQPPQQQGQQPQQQAQRQGQQPQQQAQRQGQQPQQQAQRQGQQPQQQAQRQGQQPQQQAQRQGQQPQQQAQRQGQQPQQQAQRQGQQPQQQAQRQGQQPQQQAQRQGQQPQQQAQRQGQQPQQQAQRQGQQPQQQAQRQGQQPQQQAQRQGQQPQQQAQRQGQQPHQQGQQPQQQGQQPQHPGQNPGGRGRGRGRGAGQQQAPNPGPAQPQQQAWGAQRAPGQPGPPPGSAQPQQQAWGAQRAPGQPGPPPGAQQPSGQPGTPAPAPAVAPAPPLIAASGGTGAPPGPRPTSASQQASQAPARQPAPALKSGSGKQIALPLRANCPPDRKVGEPFPLEVNHLLVSFVGDPNIKIHHYDVVIDPDKPKRFLRPVMEEVRRQFYPKNYPGFDGRKNLYSKGALPIQDGFTCEVNVVDSERTDNKCKTFKVTLTRARSNLSLQDIFAYQRSGKSSQTPQDVIQAIDVILRSASARNFIQVGRSFFCSSSTGDEAPIDLGSGVELYLGFFQSFIMGRQPYLNIDVAHKGFPKGQPLLSLLKDLSYRANSPDEAMKFSRNDFERFVKTLKVEYEIPGIESSKRTYRVNGLRKDAFSERFQLADGRTITVGEYFAKEKRYNLKWPNLPCLHVGPREKEIMVPIELCRLVSGQAVQRKLDENQTAAMIKVAATSVDQRKKKIRNAMMKAKINSSPEVQEFGLSVANDFTKVGGRILPAPALQYRQQRPVMPQRGVWRGGQFLHSRHLKKWICVVLCNVNRNVVGAFTDGLKNEARNVEMMMEAPDPPIIMDGRIDPRRELSRLLPELKTKGYELVLVVISGRDKQVYGQVKQTAEISVGILTQCVKDNTVMRRNNPATLHNIMLKINAKFNGTNQIIATNSQLKYFKNKVLMFGADVTHPSPDSKDIPSVAAVTASHDLDGFKYNMKIRLQPPRQEIITDLCNIVKEQLITYRNETGGLPQHIIFYRDGVSEGQFQQVLEHELSAINQACAQLQCRPKVTFLVVQKRHHTRFFPLKQVQDRNGNVPAGTIVDTEITHPTEIDFYLVSHASIQGVARPTKYHVLWDDANMSENDIHLLTYNLCHLFTRCDRAVSYPAPTYYAHLAASRGRVYLEGRNVNLENLASESRRIQTAVNFTNVSPMYFV